MEDSKRIEYPKDYWKRIIFTFCMGWVIIWIYRSMLSPIYPEIQKIIGTQSNAAMGLISSMYFFGYTALQIPSGFLVDKFGQKKVLIPGFIIFALGVFSIGFAENITMIYLGAAMAGIGCGTYYGAAFSLIAQHVPAERKGFSAAIVNSGSALGMIIGMVSSSFIVKQLNMPWQTMVFISAGLIVFLIVWFIFMIVDPAKAKEIPTGPKQAVKEKNTKAGDEGQKPKGLFSGQLMALYFLYFVTCYSYYLIVTWLPTFLETERGITGTLIGAITSLIAVTAVPGALYFSRMSDKKRDQKAKIIIWLEITAFLLVAISMFVPNAWLLSLVLLLYGFLGKMAVDPILISHISDIADPRSLATTLGMFNFFGMSSSVIAPTLTGFIIDTTGSSAWGFYVGAALLLVGTIVFIISTKKLSNDKDYEYVSN